jgi:hypothetical protein
MNKEGFPKCLFNSQDSCPSPNDQTLSNPQINKFSDKTTEKLYEILDFFDKHPKNAISYPKDLFHSIKLKSSKPFSELKNQFVNPQTIVCKAKIKYHHEKLVRTTPSTISDDHELHVVSSNRPKNLVSIKKGKLEKYRPKFFQNEYM